MMTVKKLSMAAAGAVVVCLATGGQSQAVNLVSNGSFESPGINNSNGFRTFGPSTPGFATNWRVGSGDVQMMGTRTSTGQPYWQADDGIQSIDLNGNQAGSIYQDLATSVGNNYNLSFSLAGNVERQQLMTGTVQFGTYTQNFSFSTVGKTKTNMGWTPITLSIPGSNITSPTTRLRFTSTTAGAYGPVIDRVSVVPFEFSPGLSILGLGACFAIAKLKKQAQKRKFCGTQFSNS